MVVLNLILESFSRMIREKLLELDFDGQGDVDEAASALAFRPAACSAAVRAALSSSALATAA